MEVFKARRWETKNRYTYIAVVFWWISKVIKMSKSVFIHKSHQAGNIFLIKWILHWNGQWDLVTGYCGSPQECGAKSYNSNFLRKSIFCVFWGPKKLFWAPKTLFGLRNLTFEGVILLKLFDLGHSFGDIQG